MSPSLLPVHLPLLALTQSGKPGQSSCGKNKKIKNSVNTSISKQPARRTLSQDRNIDKMSASHLIILPRVAVGKIAHAGGSSDGGGGGGGNVCVLLCVCSMGRNKPMFVELATLTPCCCTAEL